MDQFKTSSIRKGILEGAKERRSRDLISRPKCGKILASRVLNSICAEKFEQGQIQISSYFAVL